MRHKAYFSGGPKNGEWQDLEHIGVQQVIGPKPIDPATYFADAAKFTEMAVEFPTEVKGHYIPDHVVYRWQPSVSEGNNSGAVEDSSMPMSKGPS